MTQIRIHSLTFQCYQGFTKNLKSGPSEMRNFWLTALCGYRHGPNSRDGKKRLPLLNYNNVCMRQLPDEIFLITAYGVQKKWISYRSILGRQILTTKEPRF